MKACRAPANGSNARAHSRGLEIARQPGHGFGRDEFVVLREDRQHRGLAVREVQRHVGMDTVEVRHGADPSVPGARGEGELTAHAESGDTDLGPLDRVGVEELEGRGVEVAEGPRDLEIQHQATGRVGFGPGLPAVEIGRQGDEALAGQPVADISDVIDQPPPLLDHQDAGTPPGRRYGEVGRHDIAVTREPDLFACALCAHAAAPPRRRSKVTQRRAVAHPFPAPPAEAGRCTLRG